jgi:hypothetical protein
MFHQSSKVFGPKELVNSLVELRNTEIVPSVEVHTAILSEILNLVFVFSKEILAIARRKWKKLTNPLSFSFRLGSAENIVPLTAVA